MRTLQNVLQCLNRPVSSQNVDFHSDQILPIHSDHPYYETSISKLRTVKPRRASGRIRTYREAVARLDTSRGGDGEVALLYKPVFGTARPPPADLPLMELLGIVAELFADSAHCELLPLGNRAHNPLLELVAARRGTRCRLVAHCLFLLRGHADRRLVARGLLISGAQNDW